MKANRQLHLASRQKRNQENWTQIIRGRNMADLLGQTNEEGDWGGKTHMELLLIPQFLMGIRCTAT